MNFFQTRLLQMVASEGVPQRVLMARAGERDDRDAHEGLLASISRARRSPLVSLQADVQILLRASRIRTSTWLQPAEACCRLRGARSTRLRSISRSARMGVASKFKLANNEQTRTNVFRDGVEPPVLDKVKIISVDSDWVRYGQGRNDKFRDVRTAGGFVINATELRSVNFSMQAVDVPLRFTPSRRHGRRAAVLTAPVPKRYKMHKDIDSEISGRCW